MITAFTDTCVYEYGSPRVVEVWCAAILVEDDAVTLAARIPMPSPLRGVPLSRTSTMGELSAILLAISLARRDEPLTIYSDTALRFENARRSQRAAYDAIRSEYDHLVRPRVTPPIVSILSMSARNKGYHRWAHRLSGGRFSATALIGRSHPPVASPAVAESPVRPPRVHHPVPAAPVAATTDAHVNVIRYGRYARISDGGFLAARPIKGFTY